MAQPLYNFSPGPAMLPVPVMEQVQREWLDFQGTGVSIVELSHRGPVFSQLIEDVQTLFREISRLPDSHSILFMHGGAQMQFSAVPLNLMNLKPTRQATYLITGKWGILAEEEGRKYGQTHIAMNGGDVGFRSIPEWDPGELDPNSSYVHLTSNNTLYGTQWHEFPETANVPLVADATSDILSRLIDFTRFGVLYAGLQKNLGPSGLALVLVRKDLLGQSLPETPKLLDLSLIHI